MCPQTGHNGQCALRYLPVQPTGMVSRIDNGVRAARDDRNADFDCLVKAKTNLVLASGHKDAFYAPLTLDPVSCSMQT